ncbi:MAG: hypothetical protein DIU80_015210 [Chloroflexota bacterium]|nr:MAG: hypothetical protein DIU80_16140 [Chloroflexota bacterium]
MEVLLLVGLVALFTMMLAGGGHQPAPHAPKVIYVVAEPHKAPEQGQGGCLLLFAIGAIALLALSLPT